MVCRCVAAGCNNTHKDGVSLFLFPKDPCMKKKWASAVRRTRDKWEPTNHSVLCSKHFEPKCFKQTPQVAQSLGMKIKAQLEPDAIPTIFDKASLLKRAAAEKDASSEPVRKKRKRSAYKKRERLKVSFISINDFFLLRVDMKCYK